MAVQKYGRTTGPTTGEITGLNATVKVRYDSGVARFVGQIIIGPGTFSGPGDSGSLIVTDYPDDDTKDKKPVGLLFAGSSYVTIANPIVLVLSRFGVTVDDQEGPPPPPPATGDISGTVTEDDGTTPIPGASVSVDTGQSTTTAADGTYTITNVSTGDRSVTASADGFESQTKTAAVTDGGMTIVDFALNPLTTPAMEVKSIVFTCKVAGPNKFLYTTVTVVDGDDFPLDGVRVEMTLTHESAGSWPFVANTGADGTVKFTLGKAPIGDYQAEVTDPTIGETLAHCTLNGDGTIIQ